MTNPVKRTDTSNLGVAGVARFALAEMTSWQVGADSIFTARSWQSALIEVDTSSSDVLRVIGPPVLTHTERFVTLGFTGGVSAAGHSLTRLCEQQVYIVQRCQDSLSLSVTCTRDLRWTSDEGGETRACETAHGVATDSVGSADLLTGGTLIDVKTESSHGGEARPTYALPAAADGVVGAVKVGVAKGPDGRGLAAGVAIAREAGWALAGVAGVGVPADGVLSAGVHLGGALVHVGAAGEGVAGEAGIAAALVAALRVGALRVLTARISLALVDICAQF